MYKGGVFYAIHTDHLGTPRRVTDGGNVAVWQWPYNAFGNNRPVGVLSATSTTGYAITPGATPLKATLPATVMNLRYPGQYADSETGEFYNYFRHYDSRTGRYTQFDPIGLAGGINGFLYSDANSLRFSDPLGLQSSDNAPSPAGPIVPNPTAAAQQDLIQRLDRLFCPQEPDCWDLQQQMEQVAGELRQRYVSMTGDAEKLFCTRPIGRFSWLGHQIKFNNKQRQLQKLIEQAQAKGCSVSAEYIKLAGMDAPNCPAR
jgi:RHS repeat-associated protein